MIGDVLLITEKHTQAAAQIVDIVQAQKQGKLVIAIAGESGTGKSEIAHELRKLLKQEGYLVKILHGDNYYRILPAERTTWRKKHGKNSIGDHEYDWVTLNGNIDDFRHGRKSTLPFLDLYTNQKDLLITNFNAINVLILEGLYCLRAPVDIKFFIDLTYKDTEDVQVLRGKEPQTEFRRKVLEREYQVIQSHRNLADYFITRDYQVKPSHEMDN
ncbi:MAG: adenylyl-sulfate kinase [Fidelibacterota bacterium]